jgi:hypothetical protein
VSVTLTEDEGTVTADIQSRFVMRQLFLSVSVNEENVEAVKRRLNYVDR